MDIIGAYATHLSRRYATTTQRLRISYITRMSKEFNLTEATTDTLWDFIDRHPAWSPNTRYAAVATMHSFYGWAYDNGHTSRNPAEPIHLPKIRNHPARLAKDAAILTAMEGASTGEQAMLLLAAECGLRVAEIAALSRPDRDGDWLRVNGKGGNLRTLYMSPELAHLMDRLEADVMRWGFYFPSPRLTGTHLTPNAVYKRVRALTGYNTHALRHRAGTTAYRNSGNDLRLVQQFLGHASPTTTAIYVHIDQHDLMRASEATRLAA
jgi:integrase/recombinase XerC